MVEYLINWYFYINDIQDELYQIFICKTQFHPLRDLQLQFKSEKYGVKQNMENIIKCNSLKSLIGKHSLDDKRNPQENNLY